MKDSKDVRDTVRGDERKPEAVRVLTVEPTAAELEKVRKSKDAQIGNTAHPVRPAATK